MQFTGAYSSCLTSADSLYINAILTYILTFSLLFDSLWIIAIILNQGIKISFTSDEIYAFFG